jgi:hypothetical protein
MPKLLDLYCGAGGCGVGYSRAGFEVVGVDIQPRPHYPFEFWQMDALAVTYEQLAGFDAIHASPPCQGYCTITSSARRRGIVYPDLYHQTKSMLVASGKPFIIENVVGSPARNAVKLCGTQFGLAVFRHRLFESNFALTLPQTPCTCHRKNIGKGYFTAVGDSSRKSEMLAAMSIDWKMSKKEVAEAIPPAYTEFLGRQLISILGRLAAAPNDEHQVLIDPLWRRRNASLAAQLMLW